MAKRRRMKDRYRRFSCLSDIEGMKNAIGEMRGLFFPSQPSLDRAARLESASTLFDKIATHPENAMEYPFYGEPIFDAPLVWGPLACKIF